MIRLKGVINALMVQKITEAQSNNGICIFSLVITGDEI